MSVASCLRLYAYHAPDVGLIDELVIWNRSLSASGLAMAVDPLYGWVMCVVLTEVHDMLNWFTCVCDVVAQADGLVSYNCSHRNLTSVPTCLQSGVRSL